MTVRLEHANMVVSNIDEMTRFLRTAFPEFRVRHDSKNLQGRRWVHVGTDETYVALSELTQEPAERWQPYSGRPGTNHLGYEVDDIEALVDRMTAGGYLNTTYPNDHPHRKRVYFNDPEGHDWEFVQYLSTSAADRNDYTVERV